MYSNGSPPGNNKKPGGSNTRKRAKRTTWGSRERAGMSFLIVVTFFAVFGLIILTEVLMIDERNRNGVIVRHIGSGGGGGGAFGDSQPDYEDLKYDYSLEEKSLFARDKFLAGARDGMNVKDKSSLGIPVMPDLKGNAIPWGQALDAKVERTLPLYPNNTFPTEGSWQVVNGTRFKFFVFSAFYDRRDGRLVRIIGATKTRNPERVWCRLWYPYTSNTTSGGGSGIKYWSVTVMARVRTIRENWNLKYSAVFVLCPLKGIASEVPHAVSVVYRLRHPPGNVLLLKNTDADTDFKNRSVTDIPQKIGVCVKPMHFDYNQAVHLMEFIELNSILGVEHFTFYNHTIGEHATCILKHYISQAKEQRLEGKKPKVTIEILPWDLRMRSQKEIRTEGLFAALNDCLYRNMYRYSHLALIDFDEFIIPRHNDSLTDLIQWLSQRINNKNTGAYSFQNAFFYLQFPDDEHIYDPDTTQNRQLKNALITQKKTRRRTKLHPQKQRSKYICKPEAVVEAGNHFVWEFSPGRGSLNVPADSAILHHYRVCEFGGDDCVKTPSHVDRTAHKYGGRLLQQVNSLYTNLKNVCHLPELTVPPVRTTTTTTTTVAAPTRRVRTVGDPPPNTSAKMNLTNLVATNNIRNNNNKMNITNNSTK